MKKVILFLLATTIAVSITAQGNKGKEKNKDKDKGKPAEMKNKGQGDDEKWKKHEVAVWGGTIYKNDGGMPSKNQPAKVREAFQRDYPYARDVRWSKYRGDWTATFWNGVFVSTAVYHANGNRKDTRTLVQREDVPRRILDEIFKKRPETRIDDIIKIEVPNVIKDIFRIKDIISGNPVYKYYNSDGIEVRYDY